MSTVAIPASPFGERRGLLSKNLTYFCSLDVRFTLDGRFLRTQGPAVGKEAGGTYHVFGATTVKTADGTLREVPDCRVLHAEGTLTHDLGASAAGLEGQITLEVEGTSGVLLLVRFGGVLSMLGGVADLTPPRSGAIGSAFITTRHESALSSLRWLTRCQLFGVGRARIDGGQGGDDGASTTLTLSFDLQSAV
jgi:hypothetical protein